MLTDVRKTGMTKLTVALRNFAKQLKQETNVYMNRQPKRLQNEILEYGGGGHDCASTCQVRVLCMWLPSVAFV
jgi:hypothetical protein